MARPATANPSLPAPVLSDAQVASYINDGWCLAPSFIPADQLELLRSGAGAAIARIDAEMDRSGVDVVGLSHRGKRYFSGDPSLQDQRLHEFIHHPLMLAACRQLLGADVWVFWEQYVIKGADSGYAFAWHQDSGYVGADTPHLPYLTCWVALDDMSEANGTISVLPYDRAPRRGLLPHRQDPVLNDLVGYDGPDPGIPVLCPAGSVAFFTSHTLHRSGSNTLPAMRRSYLIQYSCEPIARPDGEAWGRTERVLANGMPAGGRVTPTPRRY